MNDFKHCHYLAATKMATMNDIELADYVRECMAVINVVLRQEFTQPRSLQIQIGKGLHPDYPTEYGVEILKVNAL